MPGISRRSQGKALFLKWESAAFSPTPIPVRRADGYQPAVAVIVCRFQQLIEQTKECNYKALRATLRWTRQTYLPITSTTLRAAYNIACRPSFRSLDD